MSEDNRNWTTTEKLTVEENGTIYAIFWDGIVGGRATSHQITNIDKIKPTITVNPESSTASKIKEVTITVGDEGGSGLSNSNRYEYYLSTSSSTQTGGSWESDTSENSFIIGENLTGTYYIHVREVIDNVGNMSEPKVSGEFNCDNTAPIISVSPSNATTAVKSQAITITTSDTGGSDLSISNSCEYYLSTSSTSFSGGDWITYKSGVRQTIGTGYNGTYYLFVKQIRDNATNVSNQTGTITTIAGAPEGINVRVILNRSTWKLNISNGTFIGIDGWTIENNGEMDFSGGTIKYTKLDNAVWLSCRLDDIPEGDYIHLFNCSITGKIINRVHSPSAIVEVQTTSTGYTIYYYDSEHNSRIVRFSNMDIK